MAEFDIHSSAGAESPDESAEDLYENAPCGYLTTTPDGRILRMNRTLLDWIGAERGELISSKRFPDLLTIGGRLFYETHFALMLRMHGDVKEVALELLGKRGRVIPALVSAVQKRDRAGNPLLNRITVFDATERRRYEQELLAARKRAEETTAELSRVNAELSRSNAALLRANEELGQFAYAASHDLQEPLRTMTTYAQLLAKQYNHSLDEHATIFISHIVDGSRRMQSLIADLLAFSQAQGSNLLFRPTDLTQALSFSLSNLGSTISDTGASIHYEELPVVSIDAARMAQVFQNLIGNSIKYRKTSERPRVTISAAIEPNQDWLITVKDNGMGFDAQYADRIFGMFKRLHGREIPGTGIGLAICKKIVEGHGGRIWATSTPGAGSQFFFTIPDRNHG